MEREHHHLPLHRPRLGHGTLHDRLVSQVNAVEVAERQDDARQRRRLMRQVTDDAHEPPVYRRDPGL